MKQCLRCFTTNTDENIYCERCGQTLTTGETANITITPHQATIINHYPVPSVAAPPPMYTHDAVYRGQGGYTTIPQFSSTFTPPITQTSTEKSSARRTISMVCRSLAYLFGMLSAALGAFAAGEGWSGSTTPGGIIGLLLIVISIIALVLLLTLYKHPRMVWWLRLLLILAFTVIGFIALGILLSVIPQKNEFAYNFYPGLVVVVYGVCVQIVSMV